MLLRLSTALACPATDATLVQGLAEAETRYLSLDTAGFEAGLTVAMAEAACLVEPVQPATAAALHRAVALRAWVRRDAAGMLAAFAAARTAAPGTNLDERLAPPGSRVRAVYEAALPDTASAMAPLPAGGWVVDGQDRALLLPTQRATLVQRLSFDGAVERTWYFPEGGDLVALLPPPAPSPPPERTPVPTSRSLAFGGAGALLLGAGALTAAAATRATYLDRSGGEGSMDGLYAANQASGVVGLAAVAVGTGLVTGAVLVHRW